MPSSLIIERLTWVALAVLLIVAVIYGIVDRGKATNSRGVIFLTIGGILVLAALISLAIGWQYGGVAYHLRYGYLNSLPVTILLGYCLWEDLFWDWSVLFVSIIVVLALWFLGYLFWPVWTIGSIIAFGASLSNEKSSASC